LQLKIVKEWHEKEEFSNLLFFAQKMDELFFDYTLDTYKPPALNSIFLCKEAIELIKDIEIDVIDSANLDHVLDELEWSLSLDPVAKLLLNAPIKKFILRGESVKVSDTKLRLEVLSKVLDPVEYLDICELLLIDYIDGGSKKDIVQISLCFASTLINMGVSKQHLYQQTQKFFFYGNEIKDVNELRDYFYLISVTSHHYEIYFIVSKMITDVSESIPAFDLQVLQEIPSKVQDVATQNHFQPTEQEVWVEVKDIETYDRHSARQKAEKRLDMVRDLFLLFSHKNRISWRGEAIITQCCDEQPILIKQSKNAMEKCFDLRPKDASKRLNAMISNIGLQGNSFSKFHRVVDLHAIGTTNDLNENQMLNIWIALETLIPSQVHGGGKIVKVSNGIMPILLRNYIPRLIERLSADLIRWDRKKVSKLLRKIDESKDKGLYQKVLELISIKENKGLLSELYADLGHFHLLRFRVFEMVELFSKPEKVVKRIELHKKKVTWQLRRIYRTRNLIVHSGRTIPYIESLVENAHDYLDQTMNTVIDYSCGHLDASTLEQAFDMAKLDYDVYFAEVKSIKSFDLENIVEIL